MMAAHHINGILQPIRAGNNIKAMFYMGLHDLEFMFIKFAGFQQDIIPDPDFADIMKKSSLNKLLDGETVEAGSFSESY